MFATGKVQLLLSGEYGGPTGKRRYVTGRRNTSVVTGPTKPTTLGTIDIDRRIMQPVALARFLPGGQLSHSVVYNA